MISILSLSRSSLCRFNSSKRFLSSYKFGGVSLPTKSSSPIYENEKRFHQFSLPISKLSLRTSVVGGSQSREYNSKYKDKSANDEIVIGGWKPIHDLKDKDIVGIGRFAVEEHNTKADSNLEFDEVVEGEQQVVSGMNYRLHVKVENGGVPEKYVAVVFDKPWEKIRRLTSFQKLS